MPHDNGLTGSGGSTRERLAPSHPERTWHVMLPSVAGLTFCALVLWALIVNLADPHYGVSRYSRSWSLIAAAAVLALMFGLHWGLGKAAPFAARHRRWTYVGFGAVWAALLVVQLHVAFAVRLPADWDAYAVYESASGLALGTLESVTPYFEINPNNLLLTLLLALYYKVILFLGFTDLAKASALLNALLLFAGTVLTYNAARMLGGRRIAAVTLLPSTVLLVLSPWAGVLYSDTAGVVFTVLILCLLLAARRSAKLAIRVPLWILTGAVAAVGYGVKPTVLICLVAAGITALFLLASRRNTAALLLAITIVGGTFVVSNQLITAAMQRSTAVAFDLKSTPNAMNPGHFLKVGAQSSQGPHGPFYGAYNEADYLGTLAVQGTDEKLRHGIDAYVERVSEMGPGGYLSFLSNKLAWITGDGSFFSWGEGRMNGDTFLSKEPADRPIQDLFGNTRPHFQWMLSLWQGTWFAVLALVAVPLVLRTSRLLHPELTAMRIALLGLLVFLLLFEARARFLYLYAPYFIVLASLSFQAVMQSLQENTPQDTPSRFGNLLARTLRLPRPADL